ncbi:MAG: hypothetical protein J7J98_00180 [candidate division Zixibacteria bacterium]|nr:hypothetical protein [candidate division Zixibacteria bacterium]
MVLGYLRLTWLMAMLVAVVLPRSAVATSETRMIQLLTIRVDCDGRYWWSIGREAPDNLPQLVPNVFIGDEVATYFPDYDFLRMIIIDYASATPSGYMLISVHPSSHYKHFGNLYALLESQFIDDAERYSWADREMEVIDDSLKDVYVDFYVHREERERLYQRKAELRRLPRFRLRHCVKKWEERDNRIMQFSWDKAGVAPASDLNPLSVMSFASRWEAGEWAEQLARYADPYCDYSMPVIAAPKVGIPKPLTEPEGEDE